MKEIKAFIQPFMLHQVLMAGRRHKYTLDFDPTFGLQSTSAIILGRRFL